MSVINVIEKPLVHQALRITGSPENDAEARRFVEGTRSHVELATRLDGSQHLVLTTDMGTTGLIVRPAFTIYDLAVGDWLVKEAGGGVRFFSNSRFSELYMEIEQ